MFGRLQSTIDRALAVIRRAQPLTHIEVQASLRDLRTALLQIEVRAADVDSVMNDMLAEIAQSEAMLAPDAGLRVARIVQRNLLAHPAVGSALKSLDDDPLHLPAPKGKESRWDFKELDNQLNKAADRSTAFRFVRPATERRPSKYLDLRQRSPFEGGDTLKNIDKHDRNLDRATVDRYLRDLGKGSTDFGPEPPTGGQPARI